VRKKSNDEDFILKGFSETKDYWNIVSFSSLSFSSSTDTIADSIFKLKRK